MCTEHYLLMDEPFSGLDIVQVGNVIDLVQEVASVHEFNTIIVVTHDIAAALAVADHVWLLGRDRDASGATVPGARIQESYDLIERGLAWQENVTETPEFAATLREVRARFRTL